MCFSGSAKTFIACASGVGHPIQSLSDVRRAEARSAGIDRPEGVTRAFHVIRYKVEPTEAVLARNLFAKHDWRTALSDEMEERGPKVPLVIKPAAFACRAERLTGARPGPEGPFVRPASKTRSKRPSSDSGEEMALSVTFKVIGLNVHYRAAIHDAERKVAAADQRLKPIRRGVVEFIVVDHDDA